MSCVVTEKGEHGATATRHIDPGRGSWYRVTTYSVCTRIASSLSTTLSGGRPPFDSPSDIEPRQGWKRKPSSRAVSTSASKMPARLLGNTEWGSIDNLPPGKSRLVV